MNIFNIKFRLTRNFTAQSEVRPEQNGRLSMKARNSYSSFHMLSRNNPQPNINYSQELSPYDAHNRSLSTEGIQGASPQKFKHMSKKLFVDRKEILSVFGGIPGRYHGYRNDKPVGGTYKSTESTFWNEKGKLDKKIVAGVRLPTKRDYQTKRRIPEICERNIFGSAQKINNSSLGYLQSTPEQRTKGIQQKVMKDLRRLKREQEMPYLRESTSLPSLNPLMNPQSSESNRRHLEKYCSKVELQNLSEYPYTVNCAGKSFRPSVVYANK